MSGEIIRHPAARRDVDAIAAFIAEDNPEAAFRFLEAIEKSYQTLAEMPEMGAPRPFGGSALAGLRMFPVRDFPTYLVFYRPTEDGIEIVRVLHGARDLSAILDEEG
jgi:toxin ParE1/3/4